MSDHVARNRAQWDARADEDVAEGRRNWAGEPVWGIWSVPEAEVGFFAGDVAGLDAIELGCGTAYVSAWLARRGARPVGIDNSERQLATARALQAEHNLEFPLLHGNAEAVPLPDASFDLAVSEYGASVWCDPYRWIPEAARLLRPGGRLVFLTNHALLALCLDDDEDVPASARLVRPYFGMHRFEWPDSDAVEFHLPHGELIALLRANGLEVDGLTEIRPPADATTRYGFVSLEWARKWPSEEVWHARRRLDSAG